MNLLYITFGSNPSIYLQASFSIYSFLCQPGYVDSINIITDREEYYKHLAPHVNIILVNETELLKWKGEYQFFWRIKIKAIQKVCKLYTGQPVMYLDCDSFLYGDVLQLKNGLKNGTAYMHENEGALSARKNKTQRKMWKQIAGQTFADIAIQPTDCMWNAGLAATPNTEHGKDCELALAICDEMCRRGVTEYFIEQFSLSLALKNFYKMNEAKSTIVHYWSAKDEWDKAIQKFFMEAYFSQWSYEKIIDAMRLLDTTTLPVFQRVKNTNLRLKKMVDIIFPNENPQYLPKI